MRLRNKFFIVCTAVLLAMSSTVVFGEAPGQAETAYSVDSRSSVLPSGGQAPETLATDLDQTADDSSDDISAASIKALVERFEAEGEFANQGTAHSLQVHLIAVDRFEQQEAADKIVKHMKSFKLLLDHQKDNGLISDNAYNSLQDDAESLIKKYNVSQPEYSYEEAVRETVYVNTTLDSDHDGQPDQIAVDIIRPQETEEGMKVPVIMDASPYYEGIGRGNESELKEWDENGVPVKFPLFYDNYFVPRGYAVVLVDMVGTNNSHGCPTTGGYEETESIKAVIDWLNGRAEARSASGEEMIADWTTGKVGMIGKSYDGTLANAVAATGVEGLETIVPITAISSWYDYYRYGGIPYYRNGPAGLANTVVSSERRDVCRPVRDRITVDADDSTGNYNDFWDERNYFKDADNVKASVFVVHGLNDYNVKTNHFYQWWQELSANDVPRKIWLSQNGHVDPFDFRREEWVHTLHRWFDHWLLGIENGIMDEPMADIEIDADEWETYSTWPDAAAEPVEIRLGPAEGELPGTLTTGSVEGNQTQTYTDDPQQREREMVADEFTAKENRLMFLSPELENAVRFSGTPKINLRASVDAEDTNFTVLIVDYGMDVRVNSRDRGEGIRTLQEEDCWGESTETDDGCYKRTEKTTHEAPYEIVTRGWLDAKNWKSLSDEELLTPGELYDFQWEALPEDYVFKPGHRIGVVIAGSSREWTMTDQNRATVETILGESTITLPIVGGEEAIDF